MREEPQVGQVWAVWFSGVENCGAPCFYLILDVVGRMGYFTTLRLDDVFEGSGRVAYLRHDQPTLRIS